MPQLKNLDDMPCFERDRRLATAFMRGGIDAERAERAAITAEVNETHERNRNDFNRMVESARAEARCNPPVLHEPTRLEAYPRIEKDCASSESGYLASTEPLMQSTTSFDENTSEQLNTIHESPYAFAVLADSTAEAACNCIAGSGAATATSSTQAGMSNSETRTNDDPSFDTIAKSTTNKGTTLPSSIRSASAPAKDAVYSEGYVGEETDIRSPDACDDRPSTRSLVQDCPSIPSSRPSLTTQHVQHGHGGAPLDTLVPVDTLAPLDTLGPPVFMEDVTRRRGLLRNQCSGAAGRNALWNTPAYADLWQMAVTVGAEQERTAASIGSADGMIGTQPLAASDTLSESACSGRPEDRCHLDDIHGSWEQDAETQEVIGSGDDDDGSGSLAVHSVLLKARSIAAAGHAALQLCAQARCGVQEGNQEATELPVTKLAHGTHPAPGWEEEAWELAQHGGLAKEVSVPALVVGVDSAGSAATQSCDERDQCSSGARAQAEEGEGSEEQWDEAMSTGDPMERYSIATVAGSTDVCGQRQT
jgi:hypothetical protein